MGFIESESEVPHFNFDPNIYLKKNISLSQDFYPYSKEVYIDICKEENQKEIIIGEMKGHFFNISKLVENKEVDNIISLLHYYDDETFDICNCLIKETNCFKRCGENIYHLDRFLIYPQFRSHGIGRHVLETFENNIGFFMENNVRYIGLFPDPITEDPDYDSLVCMGKEEREMAINYLVKFYSSFGFKKMKTNSNYMYLDLNYLNLHKKQLPENHII